MSESTGIRERVSRWMDDRIGTDKMRELAVHKRVPIHRHTIWYYFGGMTLFLFGIQVVTGILLTLYYRPNPEGAHESVRFIVAEVEFGWLIRALHGWTANLIVFVAAIHMISAFFLRAYRPPREATWMTGVVMFFLFLGFGFSGYLLPWNELAFFATQVGTEITGNVPLVGEFAKEVMRGGPDVTGATLSRFYGIHIAILPAIFTVLLGLHLYLVQRHGMSTPITVEERHAGKPVKSMPFLPNFLLRDAVGWLGVLALLAGLAALLPEGDGFFVHLELGDKADPIAPAPAGLKPEWYFLAMFQSLKFLPDYVLGIPGKQIGVLLFGAGALMIVLVPFLDRKAARGRRSRVVPAIGILVLLYLVVFTFLGAILD